MKGEYEYVVSAAIRNTGPMYRRRGSHGCGIAIIIPMIPRDESTEVSPNENQLEALVFAEHSEAD